MTEEEKRAFEIVFKLKDGKTIMDFYIKLVNKYADVRNCDAKDVEHRKLSVDFLEKEVVNRMKTFAGVVQDRTEGDNSML